jgi:hypothetical protein
MTTITDDFNRANNASLGSSAGGWSWNELSTAFTIASNRCLNPGTDLALARAESDLASADHYVEAEFYTFDNQGICARFSASEETFYYLQLSQTPAIQLFKCVAGAFTQLGSDVPITFSAGEAYRLECNGSTITCYQAGVQRLQVTNGDISGNLRTGLRADPASTNAEFDNFEAADLAVAETLMGQAIL